MISPGRLPPIAHAAFLLGTLGVVSAFVALEPAWLVDLDHRVVRWTFEATSGDPGRERFWLRDATWQGPDVTRLAVALAALALAVVGERRRPVWLLAVVAAEAVIAPASKLVLDRPRPVWDDPITTLASSSFPSGHAAAAGMLLGIVWVATNGLEQAGRRARAGQAAARALAVAWTALGAADRLFLGVHYPSDVVGGILLGMAIVAVADTVSPFAATARGEGAEGAGVSPDTSSAR